MFYLCCDAQTSSFGRVSLLRILAQLQGAAESATRGQNKDRLLAPRGGRAPLALIRPILALEGRS
jgi:hypothetical protein